MSDQVLSGPFPSFPETLPAGRLILCKHRLDLAPAMFAFVDSDRKRLGEFLPWVPFVKTVADEETYIRKTHEEWEAHTLFDYGMFIAEDKVRVVEVPPASNGRYVGNIGIHHISWAHRRAELGYWIGGPFEGHGYVTEAVAAIEGMLFSLGFNRIEICCSSLNLRSGGVPERLGYRMEGTSREHMFENGAFRDLKTYAKLRSEWVLRSSIRNN